MKKGVGLEDLQTFLNRGGCLRHKDGCLVELNWGSDDDDDGGGDILPSTERRLEESPLVSGFASDLLSSTKAEKVGRAELVHIVRPKADGRIGHRYSHGSKAIVVANDKDSSVPTAQGLVQAWANRISRETGTPFVGGEFDPLARAREQFVAVSNQDGLGRCFVDNNFKV